MLRLDKATKRWYSKYKRYVAFGTKGDMNHIQKFRVRDGLTIHGLATRVGVHENTMRKWEKDRVGIPASGLILLSKIFHVPIDCLLGFHSDTKQG